MLSSSRVAVKRLRASWRAVRGEMGAPIGTFGGCEVDHAGRYWGIQGGALGALSVMARGSMARLVENGCGAWHFM